MVVGAGIVGLCAADALAERGFRVTVVERDEELGSGCSFGNGGLIVPSHFIPLAAPGMIATGLKMMWSPKSPFGFVGSPSLRTLDWIVKFMRASNHSHAKRCGPILRDLNLASREIYASWARSMGPDVGFDRRGLLMLCRTSEALKAEAEVADEANALGLRAEVLDERAVRALDPDIRMAVAGGVYFHDDAHLTPPALMRELRERVVSQGVSIRSGVEITGFRTRGDAVEAVMGDTRRNPSHARVQLELAGDEFVVAAGTWTGDLGRILSLRMPMLAGKGYSFTVAHPPESPRIPSILTDARVAVTPMSGGLHFVGTMELGRPSTSVNGARLAGMYAGIAEHYPSFTVELLAKAPVWSGLRPCTPDGMPYLGRPARYRNLIIAAGHAMMGMSLGPISGRIVEELVAGETPSIPIDLMSPDRYG